ncbi:MAG: hypothetical protein HYR90_01405 [Candidatus Andersenbacteria bacterium]|nr:hypothetical protein [Candidatus Andersenbacteria bacterium]MBI3250814.1 hypothetical protein [Candidatus Andersenbacteria bacterium]
MSPRNQNEFTKRVVDTLAKRAGQKCSNPDCKKTTSGGNTDPAKATIIGEAAHIHGSKEGSARFDSNMTSEQRQDIRNAIWLCGNCHKRVDNDPVKYSTELLLEWKQRHEDTVLEVEEVHRGVFVAVTGKNNPDRIVEIGEQVLGLAGMQQKVKGLVTASPFIGIVKSPERPGTRVQVEFVFTNNEDNPQAIKGVYLKLNEGTVHFKKFFKVIEDGSRVPDLSTRFPIVVNSHGSARLSVEFENIEQELVKKGTVRGEVFVVLGGDNLTSGSFVLNVNEAMNNTLDYFQQFAIEKNAPVVFDAMVKN